MASNTLLAMDPEDGAVSVVVHPELLIVTARGDSIRHAVADDFIAPLWFKLHA
jgi:hypothetical protein